MFIILNLLWRSKRVREHTGFVSGAFGFLYALFRMCMEPFREPDAQLGFIFAHVTMGQLLSLPFLIGGIWVMYRAFKPSK